MTDLQPAVTAPGLSGTKQQTTVQQAASADCPICCLPYTAALRKPVECFSCEGAACTPCVKKYVLLTVEDAHCMFCKIPWQREFFDNMLCSSFRLKEYKQHREHILCEREKSRLPETQALWDTVKERRALIDAEILKLSERNRRVQQEMNALTAKYQVEIARNSNRIMAHKMRYHQFNRILDGHIDTMTGDESFGRDAVSRAGRFTMQCPSSKCNGFLNEKYVCGVCSERVCRRCHASRGKMIKDRSRKKTVTEYFDPPDNASSSTADKGKAPAEELNLSRDTEEDDSEGDEADDRGKHVCDPDILASVDHLRKASKGCPGCGVRICKIDGCDQMWCVSCHTAFSWRTGEKVAARSAVHNPHFYEWRRNNGGLAPGLVDAAGCPVGNDAMLGPAVTNIRALTSKRASRVVYDIHQEITHIQAVELQGDPEANMIDPTRALRVQFLRGALSESDWKIALQRHEKRRSKRLETWQVNQTYVATMRDLFLNIASAKTLDELATVHAEMVSLQREVNSSIVKISQRYGHGGYVPYAMWASALEASPYFVQFVS